MRAQQGKSKTQGRAAGTYFSRSMLSAPNRICCITWRLLNALRQSPIEVTRSSAEYSQMATPTWKGTGRSQQEFMQLDECLIVNESDSLVGTANKHDCHQFTLSQPTGRLHRAFSVFLFSPDGTKLLLQQRAAAKVTFPSVWTNTCCSHPLAGQQPEEVDLPEAIADGSVPGIKAAAVRKLAQELGIPSNQVPPTSFTFITRLHYCAGDIHTYGVEAEWGEHEIDYILFVRPPQPVTLSPNPEEVDAVRYVDRAELGAMMDPASGLRWSPWFRILAERFLNDWWQDLDAVLQGDKHQDYGTIHHIL